MICLDSVNGVFRLIKKETLDIECVSTFINRLSVIHILEDVKPVLTFNGVLNGL